MTKIVTILIIITIIVVSISYILLSNKGKDYQKITPQEAKIRLDNNEGIFLLDVRTEEEYTAGHIPGSVLIPLNLLENKIIDIVPNKNQEIILYCRSGNRSKTAANRLMAMGYKKVFDLGGIIQWPYDIVTD